MLFRSRLTKKEEQILNSLTSFLNVDKSTVIKHSIIELYEDYLDKIEIEKFEKREKQGKVEFLSSDDILKDLK